jgi:hypothetical protein
MCCRGVPGIGAETSEAPAERKTTSEGAAVLGLTQTQTRENKVAAGKQQAMQARSRLRVVRDTDPRGWRNESGWTQGRRL